MDDEKLTKEEWKAINKLLSYQPEEEVTFYSGKDLQNMVQYSVNIYIERGAARIISCNETEIVCGRFERLQISTKHYHKSINCDASLRFYGLSAPEGSLVQVLFLTSNMLFLCILSFLFFLIKCLVFSAERQQQDKG